MSGETVTEEQSMAGQVRLGLLTTFDRDYATFHRLSLDAKSVVGLSQIRSSVSGWVSFETEPGMIRCIPVLRVCFVLKSVELDVHSTVERTEPTSLDS